MVAEFLRRTRRSGDIGDPETFRERFLAASDRVPRKIPSDFTDSALSTDGLRVLEYVPSGGRPRPGP